MCVFRFIFAGWLPKARNTGVYLLLLHFDRRRAIRFGRAGIKVIRPGPLVAYAGSHQRDLAGRLARHLRPDKTLAFADRHEVKCDTFRRWLYLLRAAKGGRRWRTSRGGRRRPTPPIALSLVEVASCAVAERQFEIDLARGRRLRVPSSFDVDALRRLLTVLDETSAQ